MFVESKFGNGAFSSVPQASAATFWSTLGNFEVQSWSYPTLSGMAAAGPSATVGANMSGSDSASAAAGGYLIYPNMPNNNSLVQAYSK